MTTLVYAFGVMAAMGALFGILLGAAGKKFAVEVDPRVTRIRDVLPGANCGACGYPGCDGLAEAIVGGKAPVDACKAGGPSVTKAISTVMGIEVSVADGRKVARVMCGGSSEYCGSRSEYKGVPSCRAALLAGGGFKSCTYGCLGLGDCARACTFGAITMGRNGLPVIDEEKCVACGNCVKACPRGIIEIVPEASLVYVRCRNKDRGVVVRKICKVGCIGCQACVKVCEAGAMMFGENLARVDYSKCNVCGACAAKCPTKAIADLRPQAAGTAEEEAAV